MARLKTDKSVHEVAELFGKFMALDKIEIEKRTKKKTVNLVDIKPHITVLDSKELEDSFEVTLKLPCGSSFNLNLNVVIDTFCERYGIEISEIYTERTKILMTNGENFI